MLCSTFFFLTVTAAFCLPISMQPNQQQINNVPQRTLLSLWISSTHGCAAARTLIRFTSLPSLSLSVSFTFSLMCAFPVSGMLEILLFSRASYDLSLLPSTSTSPTPLPFLHPIASNALQLFYFLPLCLLFFLFFRTLIPFSHHLSLSSVWLEHMYNAWWRESCEETCLCQ